MGISASARKKQKKQRPSDNSGLAGAKTIGDKRVSSLAAFKWDERKAMRTFDTGATRDVDHNKYDYEAFLSPLVIEAFGKYMHKNRLQKDGTVRDGDNWQKGIPQGAYMKSGFRHFMAWWMLHRGLKANETLEDALCALLFNVQGYLHEHLKTHTQDE